MDNTVIYLKLGGSLITDKDHPYSLNTAVLERISREIQAFISRHPTEKLVIGHGSGSFGHTSAARFGTRNGVHTPEEWRGYQQVCLDARTLNQHVLNALSASGVPAVSFPPSAQVTTTNRVITRWDLEPILQALGKGLVPVVFGDTVMDTVIGGTILSTEDLFLYLAKVIPAKMLLLAGIEPGVWADFPRRDHILNVIDHKNYDDFRKGVLGSASTDVTGGMLTKIETMLNLVKQHDHLEVRIFSGTTENSIFNALSGKQSGTTIRR